MSLVAPPDPDPRWSLPVLLLLSTSDTDLRSARAGSEDGAVPWRWANPARVDPQQDLPGLLEGVDLVVVRLLGGGQAWEAGLDGLRDTGTQPRPVVVLGGEQAPDAQLMESSTVPAGVATQAHLYLAQGGPDNLRELPGFLSDTVLLTGHGFAPPEELPTWGRLPGRDPAPTPEKSRCRHWMTATRSHIEAPRRRRLLPRPQLAGNTAFVDALCRCGRRRGGVPEPLLVCCASLRSPDLACSSRLRTADALVVTVLAAGGATPATARPASDDEAWDTGAVAALDVPILQGLCLTAPPRGVGRRNRRRAEPAGRRHPGRDPRVRRPPDQRAVLVQGDGGRRAARLRRRPRAGGAGGGPGGRLRPAAAHATADSGGSRWCSRPTRPSTHGSATRSGWTPRPASSRVLRAMRDAGYDIGPAPPWRGPARGRAADGDALIHAVIAAGGQDPEWLTEPAARPRPVGASRPPVPGVVRRAARRLRAGIGRPGARRPASCTSTIPRSGRRDRAGGAGRGQRRAAGPARRAGSGRTRSPSTTTPTCRPATTTSPPTGGCSRLRRARAWSTWASTATSSGCRARPAACRPVRARRRCSATCRSSTRSSSTTPARAPRPSAAAHATLVGHLVPPMARAETYGDLARLEQLLDEHASIPRLDPAKIAPIRGQIWTADPGRAARQRPGRDTRARHEPSSTSSSCTSTAGSARSRTPRSATGCTCSARRAGRARSGSTWCWPMLRARQIWSGCAGAAGAAGGARVWTRTAERQPNRRWTGPRRPARSLVAGWSSGSWVADEADDVVPRCGGQAAGDGAQRLDHDHDTVTRLLRVRRDRELMPRLEPDHRARSTRVLHALDGGHVPAGPSGSPLRGLVNVLPTGRNFYAVDPQARCRRGWRGRPGSSWPTRCLPATGRTTRRVARPRSGCRCGAPRRCARAGDDIAEALALLGRPAVLGRGERRVTGLEVIDLASSGRPRIDVVMRISGFFRDAFPHVVALDRRRRDAGGGAGRGAGRGQLRRAPTAGTDAAAHGSTWRRATSRVSARRPGPTARACCALMDSRYWRDDADLAAVYAHLGRARLRPRPGTGGRPVRTWRRPTGGSRWRSRTSTPASTTSPTPTTTTSTTAAWSRRSAR